MGYDGPFDDERTCMGCWHYIKKVELVCPYCGTLRGQGRFSKTNISGWLIFMIIMAGIVGPILFLIATSCPPGASGC